MPYPPPLPPATRVNTDPQFDNHPLDHNMLANALAEIIAELGNNPSGGAADLTQLLVSMQPVGAVSAYAGAAAPSGWLLCDGASLSRAAQPALFGVIGTTYGSVDANSFNLPNLSGKFPVGKGTAPFNNLNAPGGTRDATIVDHTHPRGVHQHAIAQHQHSADHTHGGHIDNSPEHQHQIPNVQFLIGQAVAPTGTILAAGAALPRITAIDPFTAFGGQHTHPLVIDPTAGQLTNFNKDGIGTVTNVDGDSPTGGANGAVSPVNANLPPYIVLNYIIRAV